MKSTAPSTSTAGDAEFRAKVLQYEEAVVHLFRRSGFPEEESQILTQETFLRVYKGWTHFKGEEHLKTWIYQIARNIALNEIRGRRTQTREGTEVPSEGNRVSGDEISDGTWVEGNTYSTPLEDALRAEQVALLNEAVQKLPPQMRRCVQLRIHEDLKYREIAEILNISIETVKAHLFQARHQLREKLSDFFEDPEGPTSKQAPEVEISALYAEIRDLVKMPAVKPKIQAKLDQRIQRLRALQREEAAEMRKRFEARRRLKPGTGWDLLDRIERRLSNA